MKLISRRIFKRKCLILKTVGRRQKLQQQMKQFLFLFRRDFTTREKQPTPEELKNHLDHWQEWFGRLAEQGTLVKPPQHWDGQGRVVSQGKSVVNGPYAEIKESIGGAIIIKAADYEAAEMIAQDCPILELGGTVEIRMGL